MAYRDKAWHRARQREAERRERYWAQFDRDYPRGPYPKLRGNRRYFLGLRARADRYEFGPIAPDDWFDCSHQHFDWRGRGRQGVAQRREHLAAMLKAFDRTHASALDWEQPFQLWIHMSVKDPSADAVFIHSKNPNQDNFPIEWSGYEDWSDRALPAFMDRLDRLRFVVLRNRTFAGGYWVIRLRGNEVLGIS